MICDVIPVLASLFTAEASLLFAIVATGVAIGLNSSVWLAPTATIPFGIATFSTGVAAGAITTALAVLNGAPCHSAGCAAQTSAAVAALGVVATFLATATGAGVVALAASAAAVVGAVAMGIYSAALVLALAALPFAGGAVRGLLRCLALGNSNATDAMYYASLALGVLGLILLGAMAATEHANNTNSDEKA